MALAVGMLLPLFMAAAGRGGTGDSYSLQLSLSADRAGPVALEGATVAGLVHVFTTPDTADIQRVRFWLDNPTMSGPPHRTENTGPYDFNGGTVPTATAFNTASISDGPHSITASVEFTTGGQSVVQGNFTVQNTTTTPSLAFAPSSLSLAAQENGSSVSQTATLSASSGSASFTIAENASWLSVAPSSGSTQATLTFTANPSGLAPGSYSETVTASANGYTGASIPVTLTVSAAGNYSLLSSSSANRANPAPLSGATVSGLIYAFTSPDTGVTRVRFWLDNTSMSGPPRRTENSGPFDFNGGTVQAATAFNTASIADGQHTITAALDVSGGSQIVLHATFTVQNAATPSLTFTPGSLNFVSGQGGAPSSQTATLSTTSGTASFTISENATWLSVTPGSGSTPSQLTFTANPAGLNPGTHTAVVTAQATGFVSATVLVTLIVAGPPDQIHLAWVGNPATTLTVVWRTWDTTTPSEVAYRPAGQMVWQSRIGAKRSSGTAGTLNETTLIGLTPATEYEYRVRGDASQWSPVSVARTAPVAGDVSFVYVADTGLVGRLDGLATGIQQVVDEIAALRPLLVLGGGDYAYYNTDRRYGTLDNTIDAWFNQMQPVASSAPLMPAYGNHEILLGEGYDPWSKRFPTPVGVGGPDQRQNYSFDVSGVHFVSIMAVSDTQGLASSVLQWLDADLQAARAAGRQWLIPFFHATPFGDGTNHLANATLRGQLAPIFERHGVKIAIASQDQAYERSYPLRNVTSSGYTITSSSRRCYTMADGVTWVKVSPGGKLSNISGGFSPFATNPPPPWTAYRDNTEHHFAHVMVKTDGVLEFRGYGVEGDGSPPGVQDSFEYRLNGCERSLELDRLEMKLTGVAGGSPIARTVTLRTNDGSTPSFTTSESASWLAVSPQSGSAPASLTLTADPRGLLPGTYSASVSVAATGYAPASMLVTLTVVEAAPYALVVSLAGNRSNPSALGGRTVSQNIYVFTSPGGAEMAAVRFYLDDPTMLAPPRRRESNAPFDFNGGTVQLANPFDTRTLSNGAHTISAALELTGGGEHIVHATFTVQNE